MYKESSGRSLLKTISWRFCATAITFILVLTFTKKMVLALSIGGLELSVKLIAYYFHERFWNKIDLGRRATD